MKHVIMKIHEAKRGEDREKGNDLPILIVFTTLSVTWKILEKRVRYKEMTYAFLVWHEGGGNINKYLAQTQ